MFRKFRNLDKMEILQNAVNCLTVGNERLKKENENLEYKLELTKNYWEKWQKGFEAEHKRIEGLLATKEFENEELNEKYVSETDLAKVKIYDLQTEVKNKEGKIAWIYKDYRAYVKKTEIERHQAQKKIYRLRLQRRREQRLLAEETKKRRKAENLVKWLRKNVVQRNWKIIDLERLLDIQFKNTVRLEKEWKKLTAENEELKKQKRIAYGKLEDSESHAWSYCSKTMDLEDELEEAYERAILAENLHDKLKSENKVLKEVLEATKIDLAEWKEIAQAKENN